MPSDQHVTARMVLDAQLELERRGTGALMQHLEKTEPELANFVLETLSLIYSKLSNLGGTAAEDQARVPPGTAAAAGEHRVASQGTPGAVGEADGAGASGIGSGCGARAGSGGGLVVTERKRRGACRFCAPVDARRITL
jgi:hypothetical protein